MHTPDLFGDEKFPPFQRGSDTSHAAATSVANKTATLRESVYERMKDAGAFGMTDDELQVALRMLLQTETARRNELLNAGRVFDSGKRRLTRHGRPAVVWVIDAFREEH